MIAALHTIDLLAAHDEEEARTAYLIFWTATCPACILKSRTELSPST